MRIGYTSDFIHVLSYNTCHSCSNGDLLAIQGKGKVGDGYWEIGHNLRDKDLGDREIDRYWEMGHKVGVG